MSFLRRHRRTLLTLLLILVVVFGLLYFIDPQEIWREFQNTDGGWLAVAALFLIVGVVLVSVRWSYLLHWEPKFSEVIKSDGMGHATTCLSPIPSAPLRVVTISRVTKVTIPQATTGMVVERLLEQVMRIACLLLALAVYARLLVSPLALAGNLAVVTVIFVLMFWVISRPVQFEKILVGWAVRIPGLETGKTQTFISRLVQGFVLAGSPARFLAAFGMSIVMWACFFMFQALVLVAMNLGLEVREITALSLAALALAPPSAPAMPGIYHGVIVAGLSLLSILNVSSMTAYAILAHAMYLVLWLPLGMWGFLTSDLRLRDLIKRRSGGPLTAGSNPAQDQTSQEQQADGVDEQRPTI